MNKNNENFLNFQENHPQEEEKIPLNAPLARRMRPRNLAEMAGHRHILSENSLLHRLIENDNFGSIMLYGPPGCGKTTLAEVIAKATNARFVKINAVLSNVAQLRDELKMARFYSDKRTILFIDEIHRFNKSQQDLLLPDVEEGVIRLIGATTHNPAFYVNAPLLSRSHLFKLENLEPSEVVEVLKRALVDKERGLGNYNTSMSEDLLLFVANMSDGDLRRALNALETIVLAKGANSEITEDDLKNFANERQIRYDSNEDEHYDTISAFIKSMRGSDPDAAMYWLVKMLEGGEDPRFIARRLIIFASEDIGLADSRAILIANAAFEAVQKVGMPECELNLSHAVLFMATAPKSNSATTALFSTKAHFRANAVQKVPMHLRDAHTKFNKTLGNGKDYIYPHDCPNHISGQDYLEKNLKFYTPTKYGAEKQIAERLDNFKKIKNNIKLK